MAKGTRVKNNTVRGHALKCKQIGFQLKFISLPLRALTFETFSDAYLLISSVTVSHSFHTSSYDLNVVSDGFINANAIQQTLVNIKIYVNK